MKFEIDGTFITSNNMFNQVIFWHFDHLPEKVVINISDTLIKIGCIKVSFLKWIVPCYITNQILDNIFNNTCPKCAGKMNNVFEDRKCSSCNYIQFLFTIS